MKFQNWFAVFLCIIQQHCCKEISAMQLIEKFKNNSSNINMTNASEHDDPTPEKNLVYFRDDLGLNALHLTWHLIYSMKPLAASTRRGELFYYFHNQVLNHYNADRYSFGLNKVKPLPINLNHTENIFDQVIEEGYYPHFTSLELKNLYKERHPNSHYTNVINPSGVYLNVSLKHMSTIFFHIKNSIKNDRVLKNGDWILINGTDEINVVGDFIESTSDYQGEYYQSFHNMLHLVLAYLSDTSVQAPVMGGMFHLGMSMRDPIFYRFHQLLEDFYREYKNQLRPYFDTELNFENVNIIKAETHSFYEEIGHYNKLMTFIGKKNVTVFGGLNFMRNDSSIVPLNYLDHVPFDYSILVNNSHSSTLDGYVRIFISPRFIDNRKEADAEDLRLHAIELDRFTIKLPPGVSVVTQSSINSACTLNSATEFERFNYDGNSDDNDINNLKNFCLCGYPHHLLLPRGTETGMSFLMFIMISDATKEKIESSRPLEQCDDGWTLCGWKEELYPDKRMMGYPFDRRLSSNNPKWFDRSNMLVFNVTIVHMKISDDQCNAKILSSNISMDSTLPHYSIYIILGIILYITFVVIISITIKCANSSKSSHKEYTDISTN